MMDMGIEISIHALREEGDLYGAMVGAFTMGFLSTPSARRATAYGDRSYYYCEISIHALREEGDPPFLTASSSSSNFYPRPPRGGRRGG